MFLSYSREKQLWMNRYNTFKHSKEYYGFKDQSSVISVAE